jgi:dTDP-glucose 4,6-dehydratase
MPIAGLALNKQDYAAAKRDAEIIMKDFANTGHQVAIARCFAFIGTYLPRDQHFAIGNFIDNGLLGKPVIVTADRLVYRSYLFADDLVMQLMTIISKANTNCSIYNCGSDKPYEIRDVGALVSKYFNVDINVKYADNLLEKNPDYYVPNVQKIREIYCSGLTSIEDAIELTVLGITNRSSKIIFK